jgi:hypothetical protein
MKSFNFKNTSDEFYELSDNNVFIDWCIYNELIEDKCRNDQKKRLKNDNKKLWNKMLIRYEVIKHGYDLSTAPSVDVILTELLKRILVNTEKNTREYSFNDQTLGNHHSFGEYRYLDLKEGPLLQYITWKYIFWGNIEDEEKPIFY